jgi:hypothetical protein
LLGNGDGAFQPPVKYAVSAVPTCVAVGDFNDGKLDLVVVRSGNNLSILVGNGDSTFEAQIVQAAGPGAQSVGVADLNGDGKLALAVTRSTGGRSPASLAIADLAGDGNPDL